MLNNLFKLIKDKINSGSRHSASNNVPQAARLSSENIKALIEELNSSDSLFQQAGFEMQQLEVEFGTTNKICPRFHQIREISADEEQLILKAQSSNQMLTFILTSLFKSSRMKLLIESSEMYYYGIEVEIAATPKIKTLFKRKPSVEESLNLTQH